MYRCCQNIYAWYVQCKYENTEPRVFGIGDSRTGTTSLTLALRKLDVPAVHWPLQDKEPEEGWIERTKNSPFSGFTDYPYARHGWYKELDKAFPDAKFHPYYKRG